MEASQNEEAYLPVPVSEARSIAQRYGKSQVVILAYDPRRQVTHTTTYGVSAFDKENAAAAGQLCTRAVGGDLAAKQVFEDFHRDYDPAVYRECLELLTVVRARHGITRPQLQQVERILKAAGRGLREG